MKGRGQGRILGDIAQSRDEEPMARILIIEDEKVLAESCAKSLEMEGHEAHALPSAEAALDWLEGRSVDVAVVDINLPGQNGLNLLDHLRKEHPAGITIMMTAKGDVQTAVDAMKRGAVDFLLKPLDLDALSAVVRRNLKQRKIAQTLEYEQKNRTQEFGLHQIIGSSPKIELAKNMVRRLSMINANGPAPSVLIVGPTGTGKDLMARAIHYEGPRRHGPFVHINCAAIPESLLESELFGHTKGAFTSAQSAKRGLFPVADEGSLFLDELGTLNLTLQAKILSAIETSRIRPIGGTEEIPVNVQILAAMNQDPTDWIAQGKLREDLYHRLRVVQIELPPLSGRGEDIIKLSEHFLDRHCRKFRMPVKKLSRAARSALRQYHWPGNIRELSHRLESAVLLCDENEITPEHLPTQAPKAAPQELAVGPSGLAVDFSRGPISLESIELTLIREALNATRHNVTRAADLLGITRDTLRYRMEKHEIAGRRNGHGT